MAQFPGGIEITPAASYIAPAINNAAALYGQIQQLKAQGEELRIKKVKDQLSIGLEYFDKFKNSPETQMSIMNNYINKKVKELDPSIETINLNSELMKTPDYQEYAERVGLIIKDKGLSKEEKFAGLLKESVAFKTRIGAVAQIADELSPENIMKSLGQDSSPKSIDAILAGSVSSGELTLEQAIEMKAKAYPGNYQVIGTQGGVPVAVNPKTLETKPITLPGKGPLVSTTQSEGQANAQLYANRAFESGSVIDNISNSVDLSSAKSGVQGIFPNALKSSGIQQFEQAKRNFTNALLRRESGAAISKSEREDADRQYFPQFGDSPEVLAQKKANRETAIQGLYNASGYSGQEPMAGKPTPKPQPKNAPVKISSDADYNALPSGAQFIGPDGKLRRKP